MSADQRPAVERILTAEAPHAERPASSAQHDRLAAISWHALSALAVGLVTAGLTGSPAWGAAAAAGDLILRPQLQLLHSSLVERLPRPEAGR